jgi:hypothetical protein
MNTSIAENFIRSTKAPTISAGVMIANVIWNIMNTDSGMTFEKNGAPALAVWRPSGRLSTPRPASISRLRSPR